MKSLLLSVFLIAGSAKANVWPEDLGDLGNIVCRTFSETETERVTETLRLDQNWPGDPLDLLLTKLAWQIEERFGKSSSRRIKLKSFNIDDVSATAIAKQGNIFAREGHQTAVMNVDLEEGTGILVITTKKLFQETKTEQIEYEHCEIFRR